MLRALWPLSLAAAWLCQGERRTLGAVAWERCAGSPFWWAWVRLWGITHCSEAYEWWAAINRPAGQDED